VWQGREVSYFSRLRGLYISPKTEIAILHKPHILFLSRPCINRSVAGCAGDTTNIFGDFQFNIRQLWEFPVYHPLDGKSLLYNASTKN